LDQAASGGIAGEHEVAAKFRRTALRPPERLTLLNAPAGAGGGE
jgi:hypothetical protein